MADIAEADVTPLPTCARCGVVTGKKIELVDGDDRVVAIVNACWMCVRQSMLEHAEDRVEFDALLAAGVDRVRANEVMIASIELRAAVRELWRPTDQLEEP